MAEFARHADCTGFDEEQLAYMDVAERDRADWICAFVQQVTPKRVSSGEANYPEKCKGDAKTIFPHSPPIA
ncbi:MAG TPA: hypothetical protein VN684_08515 [Terriglobales bacterium]|nr:hypothetical protein [Terriglobales bacterium]